MKKKYLRVCKDCGQRFFTEGERDFYKKHNLKFPSRCKKCREIAKREANNCTEKEEPIEIEFEIIDKNDFNSSITDDALYVIGNGFDLMHGVKSSYYDFRNTIGKNNYLRISLESFISKVDIWGDFEDSLAHIDRAAVADCLDVHLELLDVKDEYDEDFRASDYFMAIEQTTYPLETIENDLPRRFRRWVEKLTANNENKPLTNVLNFNADYINFNYTEFLETLYGISSANINYIHGNRRNKKQKLILGHGYNLDELFDNWHSNFDMKQLSKNSVARLGYFSETDSLKRWKSQTRYDATQAVMSRTEDYFEYAAKKTDDIILNNKDYFKSLSKKKNIIVIGHSLSMVDYPYLKEIITTNETPADINWYFSFYNNKDIVRIDNFIKFAGINNNKVKVFKV